MARLCASRSWACGFRRCALSTLACLLAKYILVIVRTEYSSALLLEAERLLGLVDVVLGLLAKATALAIAAHGLLGLVDVVLGLLTEATALAVAAKGLLGLVDVVLSS